jgi:4-hydroxy-2-oxoheptanedioate aldolase
MVQIETQEALEQLEAIAQVPGVDAVFIGPADLAASMGFPGEPSHPEVKKACLEGMKRIRAAGKPAGFLTLDQGFLQEIIEVGCLFPAVDTDYAILRRGAVAQSTKWTSFS